MYCLLCYSQSCMSDQSIIPASCITPLHTTQLVPNAWVTETLAETVQYSAGLPPLSTLAASNATRRVLIDTPTALPDQLDCTWLVVSTVCWYTFGLDGVGHDMALTWPTGRTKGIPFTVQDQVH